MRLAYSTLTFVKDPAKPKTYRAANSRHKFVVDFNGGKWVMRAWMSGTIVKYERFETAALAMEAADVVAEKNTNPDD